MKLRKFFRLYKGFIISVGLLLATACVVFLGIIPAIQKSLEMNDQMVARRKEVDQLRAKVTLLDSLDEETIRQQLLIALSAVPSEKGVASVILSVDTVASQLGLGVADLALINPGSLATEAAKKQNAEEKALGGFLIGFTATVEGSYEQIRDFLDKVVGIRRLVRVKQFSLTYPSESTVRAQIQMDALYSPLPRALGEVSKPLQPLTDKDEQILNTVSSYPWVTEPLQGQPQTNEDTIMKSDPFAAP